KHVQELQPLRHVTEDRVAPIQMILRRLGDEILRAAHAEEDVIANKVANAKALDYDGTVEVIVACDGSPDATAERARAAGADVVLELPRGGKIRAQDQ